MSTLIINFVGVSTEQFQHMNIVFNKMRIGLYPTEKLPFKGNSSKNIRIHILRFTRKRKKHKKTHQSRNDWNCFLCQPMRILNFGLYCK